MHGGTERPEVVVVGGGPAGAVAATRLAQAGRAVVVLERERFPRYHIGESLLSATLPILDRIGVTPRLEAHGFLRKPGGTFLWGRQAEPWSFWFREDPGGRPYAFQVIRAEFDQILLDNARAHGADVREEHAVTAIDTSGPSPVVEATRAASRRSSGAPRGCGASTSSSRTSPSSATSATPSGCPARSPTTFSPPPSATAGSGTSRFTTAR